MMVIVTTIIQSGFTVAGVRALRRRVSKEFTKSLWRSTLLLALFVLWLFLLPSWRSRRGRYSI
jgi:hypothetical protein